MIKFEQMRWVGGLVAFAALSLGPLETAHAQFAGFGTEEPATEKKQTAQQRKKKTKKGAKLQSILVDSRANTGYNSIQQALDDIAPGGVIVILPGDYIENLEIRNAVTLQGDRGPGSRVRIIPKDPSRPCVDYNPTTPSVHAMISNVEFIAAPPPVADNAPQNTNSMSQDKLQNTRHTPVACVAIKSGVFTLRETTVDGGGTHRGALVAITGGLATLEKNTLRGGLHGVMVDQGHSLWERAFIVDNQVEENILTGLHLDGVSNMLATGNTIHKNGRGIVYNGEGAASVVGNKILNNRGTGVTLDRGAKQILLRLNQIWSNQGDGVKIFHSNGLIEDNDIDNNTGVEINTLELIGNEPKILNDVPTNVKSDKKRRSRAFGIFRK